MHGHDLLRTTYDDLVAALARIDDELSWAPTGCLGWSVRDLTWHCAADARRALVALHTPVDGVADTDSVSYWRDWGADDDDLGRRFGRMQSGVYENWSELRDMHAETARAAVHAAGHSDPRAVVGTQGQALAVDDLLSTLVVEAAIHHLDMVVHLPDAAGPTAAPLAEARRVVDTLASSPFPREWADEDVVLLGTGRARPTQEQCEALGAVAGELPLFR
jgi:hypothetical protein